MVILLQLFALVLRSEVPWSGLASALLPVGQASMLSLSLMPPDCSLENWSYSDVWYAYQSIPLAVLASCILWAGVWSLVIVLEAHAAGDTRCSMALLRPWQVAVRSWTTSVDFIYVRLLLSAVEPFTRVEVGGKEVLEADFGVDCSTAGVEDLRLVAGIFLGIYAFVLPVGQFSVLSLCRRQVQDNMAVLSEPYLPRDGMSGDRLLLLQAQMGNFKRVSAQFATDGVSSNPLQSPDKPKTKDSAKDVAGSRSVSTGHLVLHGFAGHLYAAFEQHASMWMPLFIAARSAFVLLVSLQLRRPLSAGLTAGMLWGTLGAVLILWAPHRPAQVPHSMAHAARSGCLGHVAYLLQAKALALPVRSNVHSLKSDASDVGEGDPDLNELDSSSVFNRFHVGALYESYLQEARASPVEAAQLQDPQPIAPRRRLLSMDIARPKVVKRQATRASALGSQNAAVTSTTVLATEAVLPSSFAGLKDGPTLLSRLLHRSLYGEDMQRGKEKDGHRGDLPWQERGKSGCFALWFRVAQALATAMLWTLDANRSAAALCCIMLLSTQAAVLDSLLEFSMPAEMVITYVQVLLMSGVVLTEVLMLAIMNVWALQARRAYVQ